MVQLAQRHVAVNFDPVVRDGAAQQSLPLGVGYGLHLAALVVRQRLPGIGVQRVGADDLDRSGQADVRRACPYAKLIRAALHLPAVGAGVPVAERLVVQHQGHGLALPRCQLHLGKGFQFLCRAENFSIRLGHVQLHNLCPGAVAGVGHGQGRAVGVGMQVTVRKLRIAQSMAEGERHRHSGGLVITIADVQSLAVLHGAARACKVVAGGGVGVGVGPSLGQLAAGVDFAGQHVHHRARARLAAQCAVNQRFAVGQPRRFQRGTGVHDDHRVGVGFAHSL